METVLSLPSARLGGYRLLEDRPRILKRELLIDNGTNFRDFSECALMQKEIRSARGTSEPCFMGCPGLLGTTEETLSSAIVRAVLAAKSLCLGPLETA